MNRSIRRWLRRFGIELTRYRPENVAEARVGALLAHQGIDLVLDVGANEGQYALELRDAGYHNRIVSFEPLSVAHRRCRRAAESDSLWQVMPRVALGSSEGEIVVNVSRNSVSSSVLPLHEELERVAPGARYDGREAVRLARLDSYPDVLDQASRPFLKIDAQGFEDEILSGATAILPRIHGLQVELSLVPLYDGGPLFPEMLQSILSRGFEVHAILPGFSDPASGRMLQVDGVFFRPLRYTESIGGSRVG